MESDTDTQSINRRGIRRVNIASSYLVCVLTESGGKKKKAVPCFS